MTEIEATYVVHKDSPLQSVGQVDTSGTRISAPEKAGYELYLTRTLRNATLVRTKGVQASIDLFNERRADALAGLKPALLESMGKIPDGRLLEGKFMTVNHGLGIPRERPAAAEYLKAFVEEMKASGSWRVRSSGTACRAFRPSGSPRRRVTCRVRVGRGRVVRPARESAFRDRTPCAPCLPCPRAVGDVVAQDLSEVSWTVLQRVSVVVTTSFSCMFFCTWLPA
jgi:hypothetical protein